MIEAHFIKKRAEYMANPDDSKLEELQFIQQERRIQHPENFIQISMIKDRKRST